MKILLPDSVEFIISPEYMQKRVLFTMQGGLKALPMMLDCDVKKPLFLHVASNQNINFVYPISSKQDNRQTGIILQQPGPVFQNLQENNSRSK